MALTAAGVRRCGHASQPSIENAVYIPSSSCVDGFEMKFKDRGVGSRLVVCELVDDRSMYRFLAALFQHREARWPGCRTKTVMISDPLARGVARHDWFKLGSRNQFSSPWRCCFREVQTVGSIFVTDIFSSSSHLVYSI